MTGNDDDRDWFRRQMADVRPIERDAVHEADRPQPPATARFTRADHQQVLRDSLEGAPHTDGHEEFTYCRSGVSRRTLRKLRRGGYSIASELDLHGLNVSAARVALDAFIADCIERRFNCVRIIHGKGTRSGHTGPVLKPKVARWLRRRDTVLAYTTARPVDGGSGALYVLLQP